LLQRAHGLPDATVNVIQGIIFVMILSSEILYGRFRIFHEKLQPAPLAPAVVATTRIAHDG
jgi:hypothetical protein